MEVEKIVEKKGEMKEMKPINRFRDGTIKCW